MNENERESALLEPLQSERDDRRRAVRVGLALLASAAILVVALVVTGPLQVVQGQRVRVDFAYAGPIKPGASVRVAGVVVGVVSSVDLLAGRDAQAGPDAMVRISARVQSSAAHLLTDKTRFFVTTLGVLGEHYLDVEPVAGTPLPDDARVNGETLARADLLLPRASKLLDSADALLPSSPEARALMTTTAGLVRSVDDILRNDVDKAAFRSTVDDARGLARDLRVLVKGASTGIGDGRDLRAALARMPDVLDKTSRLEDAALSADLTQTTTMLREMLTRANKLLDALSAGPAGDPAVQQALTQQLGTTLRSLDDAATRAARLLAVVEQRKGAAGRLFFDEAVADDLKGVLQGLRHDPIRFLLAPPAAAP